MSNAGDDQRQQSNDGSDVSSESNNDLVPPTLNSLNLSRVSLASSSSQWLSNPLHWYLYWASVTPIICGALGPALTLLAISGCVDPWRGSDLPDGSHFNEKDPLWVIVITSIAIILGLAANMLLIISLMTTRESRHTQYITIILWMLACKKPSKNFQTDGSGSKFRHDWGLCGYRWR